MLKLLILSCIVASFSLHTAHSASVAHSSNKSTPKFVVNRAPVDLGDLLLEYDKSQRPNSPTSVNVSLYVSFARWRRGQLEMQLIVREYWTDARLSFASQSGQGIEVASVSSKLWLPDTYLPSALSLSQLHDGMARLYPNGTVLRSRPFKLDVPCGVNLSDVFEHNGQVKCTLRVDSYAHTTQELQYHWHTVEVNPSLDAIRLVNTTDTVVRASTGNYSDLRATFGVKTGLTRDVVNYLIDKNNQ